MADKLSIEISMNGQQFEELGSIAEMEGYANQRELIADWVRGKIKAYRDKVIRRDADLANLQ